jgi:hypothetical protein
VRGVEAGLRCMLDAGFSAERAVPAVLALIDFVLGTVYFDTSSAGRSFAANEEVRSGAIPGADEVFEFGLRTFLVGLAGPSDDPA